MNSSNNNQIEDIIDKISSELKRVLEEYRDSVLKEGVSVDKALYLLKLIKTIETLTPSEYLHETVKELIKSNIATTGIRYISTQNIESKHRITYNSRMSIIKRIHGKRISITDLLDKYSGPEDILDYIWLRKHGYLKKTRRGLYVDKTHNRELIIPCQRTLEVTDVLKYMRELPSSLWPKLLDYGLLEKFNDTELLRFIKQFYGYSDKVDKRISDEIIKRLCSNSSLFNRLSWRDLNGVFEKLARKGFIKEYLGPYSLIWLNPDNLRGYKIENLVKDLKKIPLPERWRIISKIYKYKGYEPLIERLDPVSISVIKGVNRLNPRLRSKVLMGQVITSFLDHILTGYSSFSEYAKYVLEKVRIEDLDEELKPIYKSLSSGDQKLFLKLVSKRYTIELIEYLTRRVWDYFSLHGIDYNVLWRAVSIGYNILRHNIRGGDVLGKYRNSLVKGRINVKKTVYMFSRYDYVIYKRFREKEAHLIIVIDVSGSMLQYSVWAILSAASVLPLVKSVILFSDKVIISKPPYRHGSSRKLVIDYLRELFTQGFKGYTNISLALRTLSKLSGNNAIAVMFSDLEQTVNDTDPVLEAQHYITRGNRRLFVIVPPHHRYDVAEKFRSIGIEVFVVEDPLQIPRLLRRKLNLKIRVNIFPSKRTSNG